MAFFYMGIRFVLVIILVGLSIRADDWPQFLGPRRNGTSQEVISGKWSEAAPSVVWKKPVGAGFAGPIVSGGAVVVFHRRDNAEILEALDEKDGTPRWKNEVQTSYRDDFGFDEGPRAVPTLSAGRIYALGAEGTIRCVDAKEGKSIWVVPTKDEYSARKGYFGFACSPLVVGDEVIVNIGGEGAGVVALNVQTGKLRWKARKDEASYSSPVLAQWAGGQNVVAFTREAVCVLNPATGHQEAEFPWRSRMNASVNAATPLVIGDLVFVTASYGTGAVLLEWRNNALRKLWSNDESLSSHYATPVYYDGYLYGFHGRQEYGPELRCVELKTGRVAWSQEHFGAGTVTLVGDNLLLLRESGELTLAKASPIKFAELGNVQILGSGVRTYPAVSERRLYARDKASLICVTLP